MGTYYLPRNVKGEGRILFIFTAKSLIYAAVGGGIGFIFSLLFSILGLELVGYIIMGIFALIGFAIGTFKVPEMQGLEITRKTGGEKIDDVIIRAIKFKQKSNKIYIYKGGDEPDVK